MNFSQEQIDKRRDLTDQEFLEWVVEVSIREFVAKGNGLGWPDDVYWRYMARQVIGRIITAGRFWIAPMSPSKAMLARFEAREHALDAWNDARAIYHDEFRQ